MRSFIIGILLVVNTTLWAQQDSLSLSQEIVVPGITIDSIAVPTTTPAKFNNGMRALRTYIAENFNFHNIKKSELTLNTEESYYTVYLMFDVDTNGQPVNFKPVNTTAENSVYKEAVRVLSSRKWLPGTQNGNPIRQTLTLPVSVYAEDLIDY